MNYLILITIGIVGIWIGRSLALRQSSGRTRPKQRIAESPDCVQDKQSRKKQQNKEKILEFLRANEKVKNNDVEKLCDVSDSTATRYLEELEKEGRISQNGNVGQGVFYTLK